MRQFRIWEVARVVLSRIVLPALVPRSARRPLPERVRLALEELGGTWVKLGQALALRFDLLPPEYCYELFNLLNNIPPFAYAEVREIVQAELQGTPEEIFRSFEPEPFAAASIGQVHRAVLRDGTPAAVKVQRPRIAKIIRSDLRLMFFFARILDRTGLLGGTRAMEIVEEFARWTIDELDYGIEARHAANLTTNSRGSRLARMARVFTDYSSRRVLTMELIEGIPILEIIGARRRNDQAFLDDLRAKGYDIERLAVHVTWNALNQIYNDGYFHADPHPANLFALPGNVIGYVDFGIVGRVPESARESLRFFAHRLYEGDVGEAVDEFMRWVQPSERTNVDAAYDDLMGVMDRYLFSARATGRAAATVDPLPFEVDVLSAVRRHQMRLSREIVVYLKAVLTTESVVNELLPRFDLQKYERLFFRRLIREETRDWFRPYSVATAIIDYRLRIRRALDRLDSLERAPGRIEELVRRIRMRVQWLAVATILAGAGLYAASSRPAIRALLVRFGMSPNIVTISLFIILIASVLLLFQQGRQLPTGGGSRGSFRDQLRRRWDKMSL